ncbi:FecR family protein [Catalinimonas niigatensis]|uniref:FecR family protein n=1 Tax=Catalinimonas niigatensis TaxID=1397264 RepID=UPI002665E553|nr:FecR domain-containing protein [Catalinimonas niigatensis]WPP51815.1 FecR domain-containing protein [Catalinimonas niigatensis]
MPNYHDVEDFVSDESFQEWIFHKNEHAAIFWKAFIKQHPEKEETIIQAVKLLQSLNFTEQLPSVFQEKKVWQQVQQELSEKSHRTLSSRKMASFVRVAASILFLLGIGLWVGLEIWQSDETIVSTGYGEIRELYLPDGSLVTLNGNSKLTYPQDWETNTDREVWLDGEAFFEVKKHSSSDKYQAVKFTVHTRTLDVEVLGTAFNVSDRKEHTQVILTEGSIALKIKGETSVQMKPGERFALQDNTRIHESILDDTSPWSSWKEEEIIFQKQSLREIAIQLRNTYGYQLNFPSEKIASEKFTARVHHKDIELLFPLIARSFNLKYTINGKVVSFK